MATQIGIDIVEDVMSLNVHFLMDNHLVCQIEIFDRQVNFDAFVDLLATLEKGMIKKPLFLILTDYYANKIAFKISPYPPFDWVVIGVPIQNTPNQFYADRVQFCQAIKMAIERFKDYGI